MSLLKRIQGTNNNPPASGAPSHTGASFLSRAKRRRTVNEGKQMQYERLVKWAVKAWQDAFPEQPFVAVWAAPACSNRVARSAVKVGRKLKGSAQYLGFEHLPTDDIVPVSNYDSNASRTVLTTSSGALRFKFHCQRTDKPFEVIYASNYLYEEPNDLTAIAVLSEDHLETWAAFQSLCLRALRPRIRRKPYVYIIGGNDTRFEPNVEWEDVILEDELKQDVLEDVDAFFGKGVGIYQELKLTPFRKLLLAGVPGTGKTMLCAALAKRSLEQKRLVVYVSGADRDGATFEKIQRAFQSVVGANTSALLIVEEIDAYLQGHDKARILNILDGVESPNNPKGTLLLATTNYPEAIDDRIFKRPGRLDRIFVVPTINNASLAETMLRRYMSDQWDEGHLGIIPRLLNQPGAFVREVALHARMLAAHSHQTRVKPDMLEASVDSLLKQMKIDGADFLRERRPLGLEAAPRRSKSPFGDL